MNRFNGMEDVGVEVNRTEERIIKKYGDGGRYNIGILRGLLLNDAANLLEDGTTVADPTWQGEIKIERENAFAGIKASCKASHNWSVCSIIQMLKVKDVNQEKALAIIGENQFRNYSNARRNSEYRIPFYK